MSSSRANQNEHYTVPTLSRRQRERVERDLDRFPSIRCSVELDRENHIFNPGEVVKGHVRINVPSENELCRGVYWTFQARSHAKWIEGSGDSQVTRCGETVFQGEYRTLLGRYHRTAAVGGHKVSNLSKRALIIPCDNQQQQLVVQVVRIQRRKVKVIGETQLDVHELIDSDSPREYPTSARNTAIKLSGEWEGDEMNGSSESGCMCLHVHGITGLASNILCYVRVHAAMKNSNPTRVVSSAENDIEELAVALPQGETIFPFQFNLREDAPGSADWNVPFVAYIQYTITAFIHRQVARDDIDPVSFVLITVLPNQPEPHPTMLSQYRVEQLDQLLHSCKFCCFRLGKRDGLVSLRLALQRLAFAPGESVELMGSQVVNDSTSLLPVQIVLRCHLERRFTSNTSIPPRKARVDFVMLKTEVSGKQSASLRSEVVRIPAVFPSFDGGVSGTTDDNNGEYPCLAWSYTLELRVGGDKRDWATGVYCRTPVLICATPPNADGLQDVSPARGIIVKADQSKPSSAVLGDTGRLEEMVRLLLESQGEQFDEKPFLYQPVVKSFDPGATSETEQDPLSFDSYTTLQASEEVVNAKVDSSEIQMPSVQDSTTNQFSDLTELLKAMDDSLDIVNVVSDWIQKDLARARQLSSQDFAAIMSRTTLSLDRIAVLKELVKGFEQSRTLTCKHIHATMKVCQYDKTEIARTMVLYICDPENKDIVLNEIEWQLEREAIEALFLSP